MTTNARIANHFVVAIMILSFRSMPALPALA
jgi:hypothetical protein